MIQKKTNELKPFKDGDRVVCDEKLKEAILIGKYLANPPSVNDVMILEPKSGDDGTVFTAKSENGHFYVHQDGRVTSGELIGHILHAPTFGNLKAGDPNPFVVGMEVKRGEMNGQVEMAYSGPSIVVEWKNGRSTVSGFAMMGDEFGGISINTIFPVAAQQPLTMQDIKVGDTYRVNLYGGTAPLAEYSDDFKKLHGKNVTITATISTTVVCEEYGYPLSPNLLERIPQQPHKYEFGDKVKVKGNIKSRMYLGMIKEMALYCIDDTDVPWQERIIYSCPLNHLSLWPEPVTIDIGLDPEWGDATVHPEGIKIGCQFVRFEAFDKLAAAVAQIRDNE